MKQILKMSELFGSEIPTRMSLENFAKKLSCENEYLLDMTGIEMISRSAADELYNLTLRKEIYVEVTSMESFVQKMYDVVKISRFTPRKHSSNDIKIIRCKDIETLNRELAQLCI